MLCAASPGALGRLRAILGNIGITVLPDQVAVSNAYQVFRDDDSLSDEKQAARVRKLGATLARHLAKMLS